MPMSNKSRAALAKVALDAFLTASNATSGEQESDIKDLIIDLMHLAHPRGVKAYGMLASCASHYAAERAHDPILPVVVSFTVETRAKDKLTKEYPHNWTVLYSNR